MAFRRRVFRPFIEEPYFYPPIRNLLQRLLAFFKSKPRGSKARLEIVIFAEMKLGHSRNAS